MTYIICHLYNMTLYVIYDILCICPMTLDINDLCQYGCLKDPPDINNSASECIFIYKHILNYKMQFFKTSHFLSIIFWKSFVYLILDFRIVNHLGNLWKSIKHNIIAYRMSSQSGVIICCSMCKTGHPNEYSHAWQFHIVNVVCFYSNRKEGGEEGFGGHTI
jgi:hypothetical protein